MKSTLQFGLVFTMLVSTRLCQLAKRESSRSNEATDAKEASSEVYGECETEFTTENPTSQQCSCAKPKGASECFSYDTRYQAATLEEAMLNFEDPRNPNPKRPRQLRPDSTSTENKITCSDDVCRGCAKYILQTVKTEVSRQSKRGCENTTLAEVFSLYRRLGLRVKGQITPECPWSKPVPVPAKSTPAGNVPVERDLGTDLKSLPGIPKRHHSPAKDRENSDHDNKPEGSKEKTHTNSKGSHASGGSSNEKPHGASDESTSQEDEKGVAFEVPGSDGKNSGDKPDTTSIGKIIEDVNGKIAAASGQDDASVTPGKEGVGDIVNKALSSSGGDSSSGGGSSDGAADTLNTILNTATNAAKAGSISQTASDAATKGSVGSLASGNIAGSSAASGAVPGSVLSNVASGGAASSGLGHGLSLPNFDHRRSKRDDSDIHESTVNLSCTPRGQPLDDSGSGWYSLCDSCWQVGKLERHYFPRYINQVNCGNDRCLSGYGRCNTIYRNLNVLKNEGTKKEPDWKEATVSVPAACECQVQEDSAILNLVRN